MATRLKEALRQSRYPDAMAQLEPGLHLYFDDVGSKPEPVDLRLVDKYTLGVFFEGRDDYDVIEEVSGRSEPDSRRASSVWRQHD